MKSIAVTTKTSYIPSVYDHSVGDTICFKYGLVIESRSIEEETPKWRLYNDDDDNDDDDENKERLKKVYRDLHSLAFALILSWYANAEDIKRLCIVEAHLPIESSSIQHLPSSHA
ncbi:hypothetical protein JHK87_011965 [Glycine soja]|nr:hypothetical protein JHK87_011965 [Glycine soja]